MKKFTKIVSKNEKLNLGTKKTLVVKSSTTENFNFCVLKLSSFSIHYIPDFKSYITQIYCPHN